MCRVPWNLIPGVHLRNQHHSQNMELFHQHKELPSRGQLQSMTKFNTEIRGWLSVGSPTLPSKSWVMWPPSLSFSIWEMGQQHHPGGLWREFNERNSRDQIWVDIKSRLQASHCLCDPREVSSSSLQGSSAAKVDYCGIRMSWAVWEKNACKTLSPEPWRDS